MRFFKGFIPNLTVALCMALAVVTIVDNYNPMMGFLRGNTAYVLIFAVCICGTLSAITLYASWRKK